MNHDQFFKRQLHLFLADLFAVFYPAWAPRFRFDQVEWLEQEVFPEPPRGEKLVVDVLAMLPTAPADPPRENEPRESLALILIEAESSERLTEFRERMYDYTMAIRKRTGRDVLPVAIFLNLRLDGRGEDAFEVWFWERRILRFEYDYVAPRGLRAEDYAGHPNPFAVAWSTLMQRDRAGQVEAAAEAMRRVAESDLDAEKKHALLDLIQSYTTLGDDQRVDLNVLLKDRRYERVTVMGKTWFEEGLEKGEEKGMEKGRLETVFEQCQLKFTHLPPDRLRRKLEQMSMDQLKMVGHKLVTPATPEELGLAD